MSQQEAISLDSDQPISDHIISLSDSDSQYQLAISDYIAGLKSWRVWTMLAYQDIKLRYRRSVLGPFWLTISMAITVYSMGFLYSRLFHQDLSTYYPFLVTGMLTWGLISTTVADFTEGFTANEGLIKQIKLPYTLYVHRIAYRNIIVFFHNIFVMVPIVIIFHETSKVNFYSLLLIPGLLIIYLNAMTFGLIISLVAARFRDMSQMIKSLLQVIFFLTPIMWNPEVLGAKGQIIVLLNPIYPLVEMVRKPLLGMPPSTQSVVIALGVTLFGVLLSFKLFTKYRSRIVYWI